MKSKMERNNMRRFTGLSVMVIGIIAILVASLACSSASPTATPAAPATAAPAATPTSAAPQPTATSASAQPTTTVPSLTPTRALPTATPANTQTPQYGGTLKYGYTLDIDTMDPAYTNATDSYNVSFTIYDGLFRADQAGNIHPDLATSWEFSPDGKTVSIHLRQGVKFQDGTDFNAASVKWNFDRMLDKSQGTLRYPELSPYVQSVTVVDPYTVQLSFYQPFRPLLPQLATERMGWLVSPAAVQKYGGGLNGNFGKNPVGAGPFTFSSWALSQKLVVKKNASYWDASKPYLDEIDFIAVPDPDTLLALLRTGDVDNIAAWQITGQQVPIIERNPQLKYVTLNGTSTYFFTFNPSKAPFDNKALRQAISYSLDRKQFAQTLLSGYGTAAYTLIANGWAYNPDLKPITYDPATAKQKLTEAGYPNGVTVPIGCRTSTTYEQMCTILQAIVQNANDGVKIDIKPMQTAGYFNFVTPSGYWNAVGFGQVQFGYRIDPNTLLFNMADSKGSWNVNGYNNPQVDQLIEQAASEYDTAKAKVLYDQIQTIITQDALDIWGAYGEGIFPMNKRVMGYVANPSIFDHVEFLWLAQ